MKKVIFPLLTVIILTIILTACQSSPDEPLKETFRFRRNAVTIQINNLVADIGDAYTNQKAALNYLTDFIKRNPRVAEVILASVPLAKAPMSVSLAEVQRAAPSPVSKYVAQLRFDKSDDMIWYRTLLRKKIAFWYQPTKKTNTHEIISYIYPVFNKLNPEIILYVLKLDFNRDDNPILFWNIPKKLYEQELLKKEEEYLKKYFLLKKQAEQKELDAEAAKKLEEAKAYYKRKLEEIEKAEKEMNRLLQERGKNGLIRNAMLQKTLVPKTLFRRVAFPKKTLLKSRINRIQTVVLYFLRRVMSVC